MANNNLVKLNRGYKFRILPTNAQIEYFEKAFGCNRKLYNYYVNELYTQLDKVSFSDGKIDTKTISFSKPSAIKKLFPFMKEIDSLTFCNTQINFNNAIKKYNNEYAFKKQYTKSSLKREKTLGIAKTYKNLKGMPTFKSKKFTKQSFTTNNQSTKSGDTIKIKDNYITIPKLKTPIKFIKHRQLPHNSIIKNVTISKDARGKYYISICVEYYKTIQQVDKSDINIFNSVGLDYSLSNFYHTSMDKIANYPKYYRLMESKLKKEQQKLSKKVYKSNRWSKQKLKVSKLQEKVANQRLDYLHKLSFELAEKYDAVFVEDINLRSMAQQLKFAKSSNDNGFGMFRTFLEYKLKERGKYFIKIDKKYPSSKTCSICGNKKDNLLLSERVYKCDCCKVSINRDYNAAINIQNEGLRLLIA